MILCHVLTFLLSYTPLAIEIECEYGIPHEIVLAQAAIETGWGRHVRHNNYFNITGRNERHFVGNDVDAYGQPITQTFRGYESAEESFFDYGELIRSYAVYDDCWDCWTFECWADCLEPFAADPLYSEKVLSVANKIFHKNY